MLFLPSKGRTYLSKRGLTSPAECGRHVRCRLFLRGIPSVNVFFIHPHCTTTDDGFRDIVQLLFNVDGSAVPATYDCESHVDLLVIWCKYKEFFGLKTDLKNKF